MTFHRARGTFPFQCSGRSRSPRHSEYIGNAPPAVREEVEVRTQIIERMQNTEHRSRKPLNILQVLKTWIHKYPGPYMSRFLG